MLRDKEFASDAIVAMEKGVGELGLGKKHFSVESFMKYVFGQKVVSFVGLSSI